MTTKSTGFALRPTVFSPAEIREASGLLDNDDRITRIFIPEGRTGFEALEIASSILGLTKQISIGSGVIRLLEHDPLLLTRRVQTMQAFSDNRFFLGVGTGSPSVQPGRSVIAIIQRLDELKKGFQSFPDGVEPPEIIVATLKSGIAKRSVGKVDGILLNFCSPRHAAQLIAALDSQASNRIEIACYLKIFYSSKSDEEAQRLMLHEFLNYDMAPQYHEMFLQDGTADAIQSLKDNDRWKNSEFNLPVPEPLLKVSLANPKGAELNRYIQSFRDSGITLPVVYPYFPTDEKPVFKIETVSQILKSI